MPFNWESKLWSLLLYFRENRHWNDSRNEIDPKSKKSQLKGQKYMLNLFNTDQPVHKRENEVPRLAMIYSPPTCSTYLNHVPKSSILIPSKTGANPINILP